VIFGSVHFPELATGKGLILDKKDKYYDIMDYG